MRCVYMMTDENITANADKKILFGIMRQNMYMTEKKSISKVPVRRYLGINDIFYRRFYFEESIDLSYS